MKTTYKTLADIKPYLITQSLKSKIMAHKIDNSKGFNAFVSFAQPAWHGLGKVLNHAINAETALQEAGLDFQVLKMPNVHIIPQLDGTQLEIVSEDSFFTYRTDVSNVLGSKLGRDYVVMQNIEALNIVDEILQHGAATIETAGVLDEGRKVFVCLKINKSIIVGDKDLINQYLLICTSHDGTMSITAMPTNVRVVCANTLGAALRGKQDKIKIRHSNSASDRLREAMKVLKMIGETEEVNAENYNRMANTIISREQMLSYFGNIFLSEEEIKGLQQGKKTNDVISTRKQNVLAEVLNFSNTGTGQAATLKGNDLTAWTAYNAVTGYVTRKKYSSANDRANYMLFGAGAETIAQAGTLALAPELIKPCHKIISTDGYNMN